MAKDLQHSRAWLYSRAPGLDHPAYRAIADTLLDAMGAAGGRDKVPEAFMATLKVASMLLAASMAAEPDDEVEARAVEVGRLIAQDAIIFRHEHQRDVKASGR